MNSTVTVTEAQAQLPRLIRELPKRRAVTVERHGKIAGILISPERMEAIVETMELLANPRAMKAVRDFEAGKTKFKAAACLDD